MYTGMLHTHKLVVLLFLIHYVVKLVMLQMGKSEQLAKYTKVTKVPEMILSVGFLFSGGYMLFTTMQFTTLMIIKLICVFASIPLAVVGFKKGNKALATLAVLLILAAYGLGEVNKAKKAGAKVDTTAVSGDAIAVGKTVYNEKCANCHGADGKLGFSGAKDLSVTQLTAEQQKELVRKGKNAMPPYGVEVLSDEQLDAVVQYVGTLKQ